MSMTIQSPLNMALQGIQSPLAGIQQALQGLQQGLQGLQQLLQPLEQLLQNPLNSALSGAGQGVAQALGGLGGALGQAAHSPLGGLGQALGGIGQGLGGLGQALEGLTQGLTQGLNPFGQNPLGNLGGALGQGLGGLGGGLGGAINGLAQGLNGVNQALGGLGQAALGGAGGQLMESLGKAIEGLGGALGAAGALAGTLNNMGTNGQGPMTPDRALQSLAKGMKDAGMDMLSSKDLDDASKGIRPKGMKPEDFTPEFQAACKFLKSDAGKDTLRQLDTADVDNAGKGLLKGKADGNIGIGDVTAALQKSGLGAGQRDTVNTLRENFNALSKDGQTFDMDTIRNVANGQAMPDGNKPTGELIQACQKFLQDTALNLAVDNAQKLSEGKFNQQGDQKFSLKDLDKTLARA